MAQLKDLIVNGSSRFIGPVYGTFVGNLTGNVTGNASTATALTSNAGSATQPIYFSGGKPVATTYALNKTVPSDAVFTDTHYTNYLQIKGNGTEAVKYTQNADKSLNFAGSGATTVSGASGTITISSTDTHVTAVGNHYTPSGGSALTPTSSGTAERGSTIVMTGLTKDAAGHITGVTGYTLPASDNTHLTNTFAIQGNGTTATTFSQNANKTLNIAPGSGISVAATTDKITISTNLPGVLIFKGVTTTALVDGSTTNPITMSDGSSLTAVDGNVVLRKDTDREFVWFTSKWNLMGDASTWATKGAATAGSSPGTSSAGEHSHTVSSHTHGTAVTAITGYPNFSGGSASGTFLTGIKTAGSASLGGTTSFNTDAIKSVSLSASATSTDGPAYLQDRATTGSVGGTFLTGIKTAGSASLGGTTTFLTGIKTAGSASLTGTTTFLTGIKTAGSASLTGTTTFNTNAYTASYDSANEKLVLTAASTASVGISHSDPTFNSGTVGVSHSDPTFNTGTVTISHSDPTFNTGSPSYTAPTFTTKYMKITPVAASKASVTISHTDPTFNSGSVSWTAASLGSPSTGSAAGAVSTATLTSSTQAAHSHTVNSHTHTQQ